MPLNPPVPGLRPMHYDARSPAKVELVVQPGDTLVVSDEVAEQLERASAQFKPAEQPSADEPSASEPPKKPARKRAARKR